MTDFPDYLTVSEVTSILKCHRDTVYRMLDRGELAEIRVGRKRLIDADSLPKPERAAAPVIPSAKPRRITGELAEAYYRGRAAL